MAPSPLPIPTPAAHDPTSTASFNEAWRQARPNILRALERGEAAGLYEEADILAMVLRGNAWLWLHGDSAVVVQITIWPRAKGLLYLLAGGRLQDMREIEPVIEAWAKRWFGVTFSEYHGRPGWLRAMGFREVSRTGVKSL